MTRATRGLAVCAALAVLLAAGCSKTPHALTALPPATTVGPTPTATSAAPSESTAQVARRVHADELGQVPVLMYHQLLTDPGSDRYNETPAAFRAELATLYADGYMPVTASAYVHGRIDIPAGKHPVVLTFDDATNSQFELDADGNPLPDTAVGILEDFAANHAGFPAVATFFVNNDPFSQTPNSLHWLDTHGFEVGVHTATHANLHNLTDAQVRKEIGSNFRDITKAIGHAPTTFALPLGMHPKNRALTMSGSYAGQRYSVDGVFLVGSNTAASPFAKRFDRANIPRIRSQHTKGGPQDAPYESKAILTKLRKHPALLYTSDGDVNVVSYPKASAKYLGTLPDGLRTDVY